MEAPFLEGVPYLSRDEELLARKNAKARQDRYGIADIQLKNDDHESIEFVRRVRHEIHLWRTTNTVSHFCVLLIFAAKSRTLVG